MQFVKTRLVHMCASAWVDSKRKATPASVKLQNFVNFDWMYNALPCVTSLLLFLIMFYNLTKLEKQNEAKQWTRHEYFIFDIHDGWNSRFLTDLLSLILLFIQSDCSKKDSFTVKARHGTFLPWILTVIRGLQLGPVVTQANVFKTAIEINMTEVIRFKSKSWEFQHQKGLLFIDRYKWVFGQEHLSC